MEGQEGRSGGGHEVYQGAGGWLEARYCWGTRLGHSAIAGQPPSLSHDPGSAGRCDQVSKTLLVRLTCSLLPSNTSTAKPDDCLCLPCARLQSTLESWTAIRIAAQCHLLSGRCMLLCHAAAPEGGAFLYCASASPRRACCNTVNSARPAALHHQHPATGVHTQPVHGSSGMC